MECVTGPSIMEIHYFQYNSWHFCEVGINLILWAVVVAVYYVHVIYIWHSYVFLYSFFKTMPFPIQHRWWQLRVWELGWDTQVSAVTLNFDCDLKSKGTKWPGNCVFTFQSNFI